MCGDRPWLRERALASRVRGLRRLRRWPHVRQVDRPAHRAQGEDRLARVRRDRAGGGRGVPALGDHDGRRCDLLGSGSDRLCRARPAGDRLPRGVRARSRAAGDEIRGEPRADRERALGDGSRGISPHSPYTVSAELYAACAALGLPISTHLAESEAEQQWLASGSGSWTAFSSILPPPPGQTAVRHLAEHGLLNDRMVAAHCVKVDAEEIALLAEHDVAVAHCPRSNALLGCGIAPLAELRAAGVRVGLGTDKPRLGTLLRHVRGATNGGRHGASSRRATPTR